MNRIFVMMVAGGVCVSAYCGIWDTIKSAGKSAADVVDEAVDTTSKIATNSLQVMNVEQKSIRSEPVAHRSQRRPSQFVGQPTTDKTRRPRSLRQNVDVRKGREVAREDASTFARKNRYYIFLREWEQLQAKYERRLSQSEDAGRQVIRVEQNDAEVEEIIPAPGWEEQAYRFYGTSRLKLPKTDALLDQWIKATRQAYAKEYAKQAAEREAVLAKERAERETRLAKERAEREAALAKEKAEREAMVKWVDEQLALSREFKKWAIEVVNDKAHDFKVISFIEDQETSVRLRQAIISISKELPDSVDRYRCLGDEQLRRTLKSHVDGICAIKESINVKLASLKKEDELIRALRQTWRPANVDTNRPAVGTLKLGASLFEAAQCLCQEDYMKVGTEGRRRVYGLPKLGQLEDVRLDFREVSATQGLFLVRGAYAVPKSVSYDDVVKQCARELGGSPTRKTKSEMVGFAMDDLRKRNQWAAWQLEYYSARAKRHEGQKRKGNANRYKTLAKETAARYKAKELILVETMLSDNGYEVRVISNVGGKTVGRVLIQDMMALKECEKQGGQEGK